MLPVVVASADDQPLLGPDDSGAPALSYPNASLGRWRTQPENALSSEKQTPYNSASTNPMAACRTFFSAITLLKPQLRGANREIITPASATSLSPPLASAIKPAKLLGHLFEVAERWPEVVNNALDHHRLAAILTKVDMESSDVMDMAGVRLSGAGSAITSTVQDQCGSSDGPRRWPSVPVMAGLARHSGQNASSSWGICRNASSSNARMIASKKWTAWASASSSDMR